MRLTTKGRFAVTAMVDLGMRHGGGPVTLAEIVEMAERAEPDLTALVRGVLERA